MAAIPFLTALGRIYKLNYRQLNAVSLTLTASRFQNIFLRHAYAGSDELLHYTPPISPYPPSTPNRSSSTLPSGPRGDVTLTHTRLESNFTQPPASAIFGRVFIWSSSATVTPNRGRGGELVKWMSVFLFSFFVFFFGSIAYNSAALSCVVFPICRESKATMTTISVV